MTDLDPLTSGRWSQRLVGCSEESAFPSQSLDPNANPAIPIVLIDQTSSKLFGSEMAENRGGLRLKALGEICS